MTPLLTYLLLSCSQGTPEASDRGRLELTLPDLDPGGQVRVGLHATPQSFGGDSSPTAGRVLNVEEDGTYLLEGLPEGLFALVVHHDVDGDGRLDKNVIGIPTEPIGFANDYRPFGPPDFERCLVSITADETTRVRVVVERPLGDAGSIGAGVGAIVQGLPYVGASGANVQVIPIITYLGDRLTVLGPGVGYELLRRERWRLLGTVRARFGRYDEDDAPILQGLGDRDTAALAGFRIVRDLGRDIELRLGYEHDVFDTIGGGEASFSLARGFRAGRVSFTPTIGMRWTDKDLVRHDVGVPALSLIHI